MCRQRAKGDELQSKRRRIATTSLRYSNYSARHGYRLQIRPGTFLSPVSVAVVTVHGWVRLRLGRPKSSSLQCGRDRYRLQYNAQRLARRNKQQLRGSGGAKDMTHEAKAKAKDYRNCPRGSSRPRTCPRGLHHCWGAQATPWLDVMNLLKQLDCYCRKNV